MKKQTQPYQQPGAPAQPRTGLFTRVLRPFSAAGRFVGGLFGRLGRACSGVTRFTNIANCGDLGRAAIAGAILLGIAGAGYRSANEFRKYGLGNNAAGATVQVAWGTSWVYWSLAGVVAGAALGAGFSYLSRKVWRERGAMRAVVAIGCLGGMAAGAMWGNNVARERMVRVRAQHASAPVVAAQAPAGEKFSIVNGGVRLSGTVGREFNETLLAFMMLSGALVGVLAAKGIYSSPRRRVDAQQPFQPGQQQY